MVIGIISKELQLNNIYYIHQIQ